MRRHIFFFLLCSYSAFSQSGWREIYQFTSLIKTLVFIDSLNGFVSAGGTIMRTIDGGLNWSQASCPAGMVANSIKFIDKYTGLAVGANGRILKTTDGGISWIERNSGVTNLLAGLEITTEGKCFCMADVRNILRSTDMGETWQNQAVPAYHLRDIAFADSTNGWGVGLYGTCIKTTNGGDSWFEASAPIQWVSLFCIQFADNLTGYIDGGDTLKKTTDGGNSWKFIKLVNGSFAPKIFLNGSSIWMAQLNQILYSSDGGQQWIEEDLPTTGNYSDIYFVTENKGFAYLDNKIYSTSTAGLGLPIEKPGAVELNTPADFSQNIPTISIKFIWKKPTNAIAVEYRLQISSDSSFSTLTLNTVVEDTFINVRFSNWLPEGTIFYWRVRATNAAGTGPYSMARFMTQGGSPLPVVNLLTEPVNNAIDVPSISLLKWEDATYGPIVDYIVQVAADSLFNVLELNDHCGANTKHVCRLNTINTNHYWRVKAVNNWGEGDFSPVHKFTTQSRIDSIDFKLKPGNVWYYKVRNPQMPNPPYKVRKKILSEWYDKLMIVEASYIYPNDSVFVDREYWTYNYGNFYGFGNDLCCYFTLYITTLNYDSLRISGEHWQNWKIYNTNAFGNNSVMQQYSDDLNHIVQTINNVGIYYVKNVNRLGMEFQLFGMMIDNNIIGDTNVYVDVEKTVNKTYDFHLDQNFPNPFNPATRIEYSVANAGPVSLVVYDVLGRQVAVLVNEAKRSGTYQIEFNGMNLPSGTYVYRLTTKSGSLQRKMLLLK